MEKQIKTEERTQAEGLPLEELEAQVGVLVPDRIEMRRRRKRKRRSSTACNSLALGCVGIGVDVL